MVNSSHVITILLLLVIIYVIFRFVNKNKHHPIYSLYDRHLYPSDYHLRNKKEKFENVIPDDAEEGTPSKISSEEIKNVIERQRYNGPCNCMTYMTVPYETPYEASPELINTSVFHDLYQQHNFNIPSSVHTHVGKARGYLNWEKNQ